MEWDVAVLGWQAVDIIVPVEELPIKPGQTQLVPEIRPEPGAAGNFAIVASRLGLEVAPLGVVGDDYYGHFLLESYASEGIDTSQMATEDGYDTPLVLVLIDEGTNHAFLPVSEPSMGKMEQWIEGVKGSRVVIVMGYLLIRPDMAELAVMAVREAAQAGRDVFFDPGPLVPQMDKDALREVMSLSTVILANLDEAKMITENDDPEVAAQRLCEVNNRYAVVKLGGDGCLIASRSMGVRHFPSFPVAVRDTTAAGDSFAAAFARGFIENWNIERIAQLANATGAAAVQKLGSGFQVPTRDEVMSILEDNGVDISL